MPHIDWLSRLLEDDELRERTRASLGDRANLFTEARFTKEVCEIVRGFHEERAR